MTALTVDDITPGHYWVRNRKDGALSIVRVVTYEIVGGCKAKVELFGWDGYDSIDAAMLDNEFLARIETPEFPA
jgi:hypothetical protein